MGQETTEENQGRSQIVGEEALLHEKESKQCQADQLLKKEADYEAGLISRLNRVP